MEWPRESQQYKKLQFKQVSKAQMNQLKKVREPESINIFSINKIKINFAL